jgi:hypothetical protein
MEKKAASTTTTSITSNSEQELEYSAPMRDSTIITIYDRQKASAVSQFKPHLYQDDPVPESAKPNFKGGVVQKRIYDRQTSMISN